MLRAYTFLLFIVNYNFYNNKTIIIKLLLRNSALYETIMTYKSSYSVKSLDDYTNFMSEVYNKINL